MSAAAKYRKKPVEIEAMRIDLDAVEGLAEWLGNHGFVLVSPTRVSVHVHTLEGVMVGREGDYIIKGVAGEFYPCKPEIFEATYEAVAP